MTNFEFYKGDLQKLNNQSDSCFAFVDGKIVDCEMFDCKRCAFNNHCSESVKMAWLLAEHIEKPKLTKVERAFCEAAQTGFIARDKNKSLFLFKEKPLKEALSWTNEFRNYVRINGFFETNFKFIKWTDAEPWSIESLLELEVEA